MADPGRPARVPCLILVGGLGIRLRSVISDLPKPMAPIAGKPFLEYLIRWVASHGFEQFVLCAGYRAEAITRHFGNGEQLGVQIEYSLETEPLGTWGAIRKAMGTFAEDYFLVFNGDSFLQFEINCLVDFHIAKKALASLAVVQVADGSRFGSVRVSADGHIDEFCEKRTRGPVLINGGVYCLSRKVIQLVSQTDSSLERDVFPRLIAQGLYGMRVHGEFFDIGVAEEYVRLAADSKRWVSHLKLASEQETKC